MTRWQAHAPLRVRSACCHIPPCLSLSNSLPPPVLFWPGHAACGILVSQSGIEAVPHAVEVRSLNHWTTREVPSAPFLMKPFVFYGPFYCLSWTKAERTSRGNQEGSRCCCYKIWFNLWNWGRGGAWIPVVGRDGAVAVRCDQKLRPGDPVPGEEMAEHTG